MWETICRGFRWKRKRDDDRFQRAEVTGSHLLAAWGRCSTQVEKKKSGFFQTLPTCQVLEWGFMFHGWFPMQNTVAEHFWQVLVALQ